MKDKKSPPCLKVYDIERQGGFLLVSELILDKIQKAT